MNKNIEVEGSEIVIRNSKNDVAIIPKNKAKMVIDLLKEKNHSKIDEIVNSLPLMKSYAEDGTVITNDPVNLFKPNLTPQKTNEPFINNLPYSKDIKPIEPNEDHIIQDNLSFTPINKEALPLIDENEVKFPDAEQNTYFSDLEKQRTETKKTADKGLFQTIITGGESESMFAKTVPIEVEYNTIVQDNLNIQPESVDFFTRQKIEYDKKPHAIQPLKPKLTHEVDKTKLYKGYNKKEYSIEDFNTTKDLQTFLYKKGYYDGLYRKGTSENIIIDGKFGDKTNKAYDKYISASNDIKIEYKNVKNDKNIYAAFDYKLSNTTFDVSNINTNGKWMTKTYEGDPLSFSVRNEHSPHRNPEGGLYGCSGDMQCYYMDEGVNIKKKGMIGHAWTIRANILEAGGTSIYNGFKTIKKPLHGDLSASMGKQIQSQKLPEQSLIHAGDVVNLYYQRSPAFNDAAKGGTGGVWSTHTGWITEKNGQKYVTHSVHGHVTSVPLEQFYSHKAHYGSHRLGITAITRPEGFDNSKVFHNMDMREYGVTPNSESELKRSNKILGPGSYETIIAGEKNLNKTKEVYGLTDEEALDVFKLSLGLIYAETVYGDSSLHKKYQKIKGFGDPIVEGGVVRSIKNAVDIDAYNLDETSEGLAQIKMNKNLTPEMKKAYGIKDYNDLNIPEKVMPLVMGMMAMRMNYLKKVAKEHPELKLTDERIKKAALLMHNQGLDFVKNRINKSPELLEKQRDAVAAGKMKEEDVGFTFDFIDGKINYFDNTYTRINEYLIFDDKKILKSAADLSEKEYVLEGADDAVSE